MMKFKPVLHRVLIKPDKLEETTSTGIIIKYDKREEAAVERGVVILVGSTAYNEFGSTAAEQGIVPGARVSFAKYAGKTIMDGDTRYICCNDEDIVGVIEDE